MDKNKVKCPFCGHEQKVQYMQNVGVFSSGARGAIVKKNLK